MKWYNFLLFMLVITTACSSKQMVSKSEEKSIISNEITDKKWRLIEIQGEEVPSEINGKMPFIFMTSETSRITGNAGCNVINGSFKISENNKMEFKQMISTMMACLNMEVESKLMKALEMVDNYTVNDDVLSLNKGRMAPLARFQFVIEETASLAGTWNVNYVEKATIPFEKLYPRQIPFITFLEEGQKAVGHSGCNTFNAGITVNGNQLRFANIASTRMFCEGDGETLFFNAIKKVDKYSVNDDGKTLNLIAGDIAVIRLVKK